MMAYGPVEAGIVRGTAAGECGGVFRDDLYGGSAGAVGLG